MSSNHYPTVNNGSGSTGISLEPEIYDIAIDDDEGISASEFTACAEDSASNFKRQFPQPLDDIADTLSMSTNKFIKK